jgi:hypothetical protein
MIRIIAKLFAFAVFLTAFLPVAPLFAANVVTWISSTGSDANPCTAALPCATFFQAITEIGAGLNGQINCLNSPGINGTSIAFSDSVTIDCAGVFETNAPNAGALNPVGTNQVVKIRNLTISGTTGGWPAIKVTGSGTLIIENCVFENIPGTALDIEPNGPLNLVLTNSRISNSASGVLLKPVGGGSVTATFDRVTIADNSGGGFKADSTNGPITVDISNSTISKNASNGLNAVSGTNFVYQNILSLSHDVIASNGIAGVQANGQNAAVLIDTTLLDSNASGATASINAARIITYGNNRIIGPLGSGFFGTSTLQ